MTENNTINLSDYSPKYNVGKTALEIANEKMRTISTKKEAEAEILTKTLEKNEDVIERDGKILHNRSSDDYLHIWEAFRESQISDYTEYMGYSEDTINRIGVVKFIDMMDWRTPEDVAKWKTDQMHIVPCIHCGSEFAIFEEFGLCHKCSGLYDLDALIEVMDGVSASVKEDGDERLAGVNVNAVQMINFVYDDEIRKMFLIGSTAEQAVQEEEPVVEIEEKEEEDS